MKKHIIKHDVPVPVAASADPLAGLILVQPDYVHYSPDGGAGTWTETPQPDSTLIRGRHELSAKLCEGNGDKWLSRFLRLPEIKL